MTIILLKPTWNRVDKSIKIIGSFLSSIKNLLSCLILIMTIAKVQGIVIQVVEIIFYLQLPNTKTKTLIYKMIGQAWHLKVQQTQIIDSQVLQSKVRVNQSFLIHIYKVRNLIKLITLFLMMKKMNLNLSDERLER